MEKKYEMLKDDTIEIDGTTLYRIRALRSFYGVIEGDLGGYIEKEENLSHEGICWVFRSGRVYQNARISEHAFIGYNADTEETRIFGNAEVYGGEIRRGSKVYGNACIQDNVKLYHCTIYGDALLINRARIENSKIHDDVTICGEGVNIRNSILYGKANITGNSRIEESTIHGSALIKDNAFVSQSTVYENAVVKGNSKVSTFSKVHGKAIVQGSCWVVGMSDVHEDGPLNDSIGLDFEAVPPEFEKYMEEGYSYSEMERRGLL